MITLREGFTSSEWISGEKKNCSLHIQIYSTSIRCFINIRIFRLGTFPCKLEITALSNLFVTEQIVFVTETGVTLRGCDFEDTSAWTLSIVNGTECCWLCLLSSTIVKFSSRFVPIVSWPVRIIVLRRYPLRMVELRWSVTCIPSWPTPWSALIVLVRSNQFMSFPSFDYLEQQGNKHD